MDTNEELFHVMNRHVADCGTPPPWVVHGDGGRRFYGQNELGEQMVIEVKPKLLRLVMGDRGWDRPVVVKNPRYGSLLTGVLERLKTPGHFPASLAHRSPLDALMLDFTELMVIGAALRTGAALQSLERKPRVRRAPRRKEPT
jgi:hypothetical protein